MMKSKPETININVKIDGIDKRLDHYLNEKIKQINPEEFSRSQITQAIKLENCTINGRIVKKPSHKLKENDEIEIKIFISESEIIPDASIKFEIIYEDEYLLVISKPQGLVVHPAPGLTESTLVHGIYGHLKESKNLSKILESMDEQERLGIVHRLDKDTSGLMVVAKTMKAKRSLQDQLKPPRSMKRIYHAITMGELKKVRGSTEVFSKELKLTEIILDVPIARDPGNRTKYVVSFSDKINTRNSKTTFRIKKSINGFNLIECELETGRTHQIRVHLEYLKNYIIGDKIYNKNKQSKLLDGKKIFVEGQLLHAVNLSFIHPETKIKMYFTAPYPDKFVEVLRVLNLD